MSVELTEIVAAEVELEERSVEQAGNGISEIVLVGLLRDYADDIKHLGYAPRMWGPPKPTWHCARCSRSGRVATPTRWISCYATPG